MRGKFTIGLLAGVVAGISSGAGMPFIAQKIVPLVTESEGPRGTMLILILCYIPIVFALRAIGSYTNAYFTADAGMHVLESIRMETFRKLQYAPLAFFKDNQIGDLMSRVMADTQQLQTALIRSVNTLVKEPITMIGAIVSIIYLCAKDAAALPMLLALALVPICTFPIKMIGKRILKKARQQQEQAGQLGNVLEENLSSVREIRAYNLEDREINRFALACRKFLRHSLKTVKYSKALSPLIELVSSFTIVFALYVAVDQQVKEESVMAILAALYMCYDPIKKLGEVSNVIRAAEASLDRLEFILHTEDSVPDASVPVALPRVSGKIDFNNVSFRYESGEDTVLDAVSVNIKAGEVVALVGPSGAGKSTFANLVPRFYDPSTGSIQIDGIDIRSATKEAVRSQIALVSQEAILFDDTIGNNILLGRRDASRAEVEKAAQLANAEAFILAKENGYETGVGEGGKNLSGGQRQRISIARAFLKDAPIIILDEPTSALDAESEHQIQEALTELSKGRTVLIIAHRFSTIQHADRILVFEAGKIIATGTHEALYPTNTLYRSLYDKQASAALNKA